MDLYFRKYSRLINWWIADRPLAKPANAHPAMNYLLKPGDGIELRHATMLEF